MSCDRRPERCAMRMKGMHVLASARISSTLPGVSRIRSTGRDAGESDGNGGI